MEMSGWAEGALWRLYFDCCLSGDYWKLTVINLGVGNKDFTSFIYSCRLCLVYDHKKLIENVFLFLSSAEYAIRMREQNNFLACVIMMTNLRWEMNVFHHLKQFDPLSCYSSLLYAKGPHTPLAICNIFKLRDLSRQGTVRTSSEKQYLVCE